MYKQRLPSRGLTIDNVSKRQQSLDIVNFQVNNTNRAVRYKSITTIAICNSHPARNTKTSTVQ